MSPIGRIFIVINLVLAAAFIGFTGTYLQKATDWKQKYDAEVVVHQSDNDTKDQALAALQDDVATAERQLAAADANTSRLSTEVEEKNAEIERSEKRLNTMEGDLAKQQANYAKIADAIDRATQDAAQARQSSIAAGEAKDAALRVQETATADLRDAQAQIASLQTDVGARDVAIVDLESANREKDVLLSIVRDRAPGLLALAQPTLGGTVQHVDASGRLLTVTVTDNPAEADIKPGYSFAIFEGTNYKGEARITSVDGRFAFCRVTNPTGDKIKVGDSARTNTAL
jgi:hypothetical protein